MERRFFSRRPPKNQIIENGFQITDGCECEAVRSLAQGVDLGAGNSAPAPIAFLVNLPGGDFEFADQVVEPESLQLQLCPGGDIGHVPVVTSQRFYERRKYAIWLGVVNKKKRDLTRVFL